MSTIQHPDAQLELSHLESTLGAIDHERALAETELQSAADELTTARRFMPDDIDLRQLLYDRAYQQRRNLSLAALKPYFTRVDFKELSGDAFTYYIGKYGVVHSRTLDVHVVDWRSPVANLYYSGQVGPMHYVAPDGEVRGELTLKRQFGIENSELKTIFDTDVVSQDAYLQSVLGAMTGDRLREIVTTIQAEQNFVIRHPPDQPLVVQGVAGSGKTTIALHRVAYLLYSCQERMMPQHMLILAPNPLFLNYISGVLPDLGVERVWQTTFAQLMTDWLDGALPRLKSADTLSSRAAMDETQRAAQRRTGRLKGSLELGRRASEFMDAYEERFVPEGEIKFGPVVLYTHEQLRRFILEDVKPFPLARRLEEFKKQLKRRTKDAQTQVIAWLNDECDRRAQQLKLMLPDGAARRERLTRLYDSRDQRLKQTKEAGYPFRQKTLKRWPALSLTQCYRQLWTQLGQEATYADTARETIAQLDEGYVTPEDIAPMALIAMRLFELERLDIRHTVIDEAQDFSPLEFELLRRVSGNRSFTIVGDLMQGVNSWRGINDWAELTEGVFEGRATAHHLVTSYRSTVEIMNLALRVARNRPVPGQKEAQPVLRHGDEPMIVIVDDAKQQQRQIAGTISEWMRQGMTTVAVIVRDMAQAKHIKKALPDSLGATILDITKPEYQGGVLIAPASSVKGLEFDGVIMADVSRESFPDTELDARLLYVCLTRPLHKLLCVAIGEVTELLTAPKARCPGTRRPHGCPAVTADTGR